VANTLSTYAIGKVVLVSRYESDDNNGKSPKEILTKAKRIAIANPRSAPYGVAAMEALENLGVAEESQKKLVMGNNIAQAWQFFFSGNAEVTIVAESLVYSSVKEQQHGLVTIDLSSYLKHPVRQGLVAIKPMLPLAQEFLDFMTTSVAEKIIIETGYLLPTPTNIKSPMNGIITPAIMTP
jgi:molybdate transport system substrate-binding protein